ncbi:MAG: hypothetical protein ACYC7E_11990 [Armatimonadota bacterium]
MEMEQVVTSPFTYDFSRNGNEEAVDRQFNTGFTIMGILEYWHLPFCSPIWEHADHWEDFVRACVTHYRDRIKYWEIINEPPYGWLMPGAPQKRERAPVAEYAKLLRIASRVIREVDPLATVLCGASMYDGKFLRLIYEHGCKDDFDIATVHYLHCDHPRQFQQEYDLMRSIMAEFGDADKPLWDTENGTGGEIEGKHIQTQIEIYEYIACYNVYRHCLAHASGLQRYFWFNPNWDWQGDGKELVHVRDAHGRFTKPYGALQVMTGMLGDSVLLHHRSLGDDVHIYVFNTSVGPISVAWATTPSTLHLSSRCEAKTAFGESMTLQAKCNLDHIPLFIEGDILQTVSGWRPTQAAHERDSGLATAVMT